MADNLVRGVDILVPYHGQYAAVRELVGSLFMMSKAYPFQVTLIDDASPNTDFFFAMAQVDSRMDGIRMEEHKGFAACINKGVELTKQPWIVVINSDCIVRQTDWLLRMYKSLSESMKNKVGMVSAVTNNGSGCKEIERSRYAGEDKQIISSVPLPLICAMMPRKLFDRVGPLKEYPYGYFEDETFFYQMKSRGYKQAICENSWVYHEGGLTVKALWEKNPKIEKIMCEDNRQRCLDDVKKLTGKK